MKNTENNLPEEKKAAKPARKDKKPGKIPSLLTKKYTKKNLEKRIYKKIYIPADKKFVESFIVECEEKNKKGQSLYSIPKDSKIAKKDCNRLKTICKEIKKQKGGFKWQPLAAIVIFIVLLCTAVTLTKNIVLKKVITSTCESIFEAKTDIESVNLKFSDSSFKLKGLQVANKKEPMKNLFQIDSIVLDFEFSQLLKANLIADELSVNGFATNTDRTVSGDLTAKKLAKLEKKKAKQAAKAAKQNEDSAFMKNLTAKKESALSSLKASVSSLFDKFNPEKIIQDCYSQMQTPEVSKKVEEQSKELVTKYQNTPKEMEAEINKVKASAEAAAAIDISKIKNDPAKVAEAVKTISDAYTSIENLKTKTETMTKDFKADVNTAASLSKEIQAAIKHDNEIVSSKLNEITSLNLNDAKNFISDTFDNVGYSVFGQYYPYLRTAINYLINLKNTNKSKDKKIKIEQEKSTVSKRAKGRVVYFKTQSYPKVWIKKVSGSGTNFALNMNNITTDMDKTGKPATGNVSLNLKSIKHSADLTIDTRSESVEPLVLADYTCSSLPLSYPSATFTDVPGIPGLDSSVSTLNLTGKFYDDESFTIGGKGLFEQMKLSSAAFEPEAAYKIYENTLSKINSMTLNIEAGYKAEDGIIMNLSSDADKKFLNALSASMTDSMSGIIDSAKSEMTAKISDLTGGALGNLDSFTSLSGDINSYSQYLDSIMSKLNSKKTEAENAAKSAAKDKATSAASDAASSLLKGLKK